jgi:hypothetical protein
MEHRSLPKLLRDAERRVNARVFRTGGDDSLASIPANRDRDVDLLLMEAAERLEQAEALIRQASPSRSILTEEGAVDWQARRFEWLSDSASTTQTGE